MRCINDYTTKLLFESYFSTCVFLRRSPQVFYLPVPLLQISGMTFISNSPNFGIKQHFIHELFQLAQRQAQRYFSLKPFPDG